VRTHIPKATYDVHAVFSVHVCHSLIYRIICSLLYDCLLPPLFSSFFFLVYTNGIHSLWALHLLGISLEYYDILAHVAFDISPSINQVYTAYYWKFQHITGLISYGWYSEVYSSHCISLLYDCTLMSTHFHCIYFLYTVYTLCWHCHNDFTYTKRIYIWYIYGTRLSTKSYIVYTTCIHPISFF